MVYNAWNEKRKHLNAWAPWNNWGIVLSKKQILPLTDLKLCFPYLHHLICFLCPRKKEFSPLMWFFERQTLHGWTGIEWMDEVRLQNVENIQEFTLGEMVAFGTICKGKMLRRGNQMHLLPHCLSLKFFFFSLHQIHFLHLAPPFHLT